MMRAVIAAALMIGTASLPTEAEASTTGNELKRQCESDGFLKGVCAGFIVGVMTSAELHGSKLFCVPAGVENGQLVAIVQRYMDANPQNLHNSATAVVAVALAQAFPCRD